MAFYFDIFPKKAAYWKSAVAPGVILPSCMPTAST